LRELGAGLVICSALGGGLQRRCFLWALKERWRFGSKDFSGHAESTAASALVVRGWGFGRRRRIWWWKWRRFLGGFEPCPGFTGGVSRAGSEEKAEEKEGEA
jgi:hypothetical protein